MQSSIARLGLILSTSAALAGCGGEAVAGGQRDVDVHATGDGPGGASPSRMPAGPRWSLSSGSAVQGTITLIAAPRLVSGSVPVAVTPTAPSAQVLASGGDTVLIARDKVPPVSYATARVVFRDVQANVTGGLSIGGVPLTGLVEVDIAPGDSVVVERTVSIPAGDEPIDLLVDLNAAVWLAAASVGTRLVPALVFRNAVQIQVR
jgi:hypothetical protein